VTTLSEPLADERDDQQQPERESYGRGAGILAIGVGATGLLTAVFFVIASHVLTPVEAKRVDLLWAIMWVAISVIYRPVEQLLSRTIAQRRAEGYESHPLRGPALIQIAFGLSFLAVALIFHDKLKNDAFDGSTALYLILLLGIAFYAVSYFARGWLAGHQHFKLYGGLLFMESSSRCAFALAVAVGIAHGQVAVAAGIAVAPLVSLVVLPLAFGLAKKDAATPQAEPADSVRASTRFAASVAGIMLAEQIMLNAPVVSVELVSHDKILAGIVFNVLLIARAPLQLFMAVQTSLLPHLAKLEVRRGHDDFESVIRLLVTGLAALGLATALGLLLIGPFVMSHLFGQDYDYGRVGLALVGFGMGLHLIAGTFNQAALARQQDRVASAAWLSCGAAFLIWTFVPVVGDPLLRVEIGYAATTAVLAVLLYLIYRAGRGVRATLPGIP
jgi:O-antigen/teichoic acid export membrane protein